MNPWTAIINLLAAGLFALSQIFGGSLGWAIFTISLLARLAIMPLSIKLAERSRRQRNKIQAIQPQLDKIKRRYARDSTRLAAETMKLYRQNDIKPFDLGGLAGAFLQLPIFMGLFGAIRKVIETGGSFLWIGDIARPDAILAVMVGGLTYLSASLNPDLSHNMRWISTLLPALLMVIFYWKFAAGLGIYGLASQLISVAQGGVMKLKRG
jgi:YidC/Oxa1 family membrane protein insertase